MVSVVFAAGGYLIFSLQGPDRTGPQPSSQNNASSSGNKPAEGPAWTRHRTSSGDSPSRLAADRLAFAASRESGSSDDLRRIVADKSISAGERIFACQQLALVGSGEAMQALFEAIAMEADSEVKGEMCEALDLLTNEEGIVALASIAVATTDLLLLQAAEDCLARCSTPETVRYLADLHAEFRQDSAVAGRLCSLLESAHSPQATTTLSGLLHQEAPTDLFRAASVALAKSPGRDAARELVNATRRPLTTGQREVLREAIASSIEPEHFAVFRDEAGETREEFWISAYSLALAKEIQP